jgi:hypothetical protein
MMTTRQQQPLDTKNLLTELSKLGWAKEHHSSTQPIPTDFTALYFMGRSHPVLLAPRKEHILGRRTPGSTKAPTFDISAIYPEAQTVSRQHSSIIINEDGYRFIQDLGSRNGTWLNQEQLEPHKQYPMPNGSRVQLGNVVFYLFWER